MKTLTESIIGRKNSIPSWPVLDKIRNPKFWDLISYNIVKVDYSEPNGSKYGIVIPEKEALKLFPREYKKFNGAALIFYNPSTVNYLIFSTVSNYIKLFPKPVLLRPGYEITDIWDGSKYRQVFEYRLKHPDDYVEFLEQSVINPEEFEKMLKP